MDIMFLASAPKVPVPFDARVLHKAGPVEVIHILLHPGEGVPPHDNSFDVLFYVLEGCGELTIENEVRQVAADNLIPVATGTLRSWKNTGTDPVRLLVIKLLNDAP
jgi:quercetin dioxygenase-like cupin family protein